MKKLLVKSAVFTILTLTLTFLIGKLSETRAFRFIFPEIIALEGFDLTDLVFKERKEPQVNEEIVVVNIGRLPRRGIAELLQIISKYKPKVIGIDSFFDCRSGSYDTVSCPQLKDTLGNLMLSKAIREAGNVILISQVLQRDTLLDQYAFDSLRRSDSAFLDYAYRDGYANLDTDAAFQGNVKICRTFNPKQKIRGKPHYAFAVQMALLYDSTKAQKFLKRDNTSEVINFRGNVVDLWGSTNYPQMFYALDVDQVLNEDFVPEMIKDKIVIFGFIGESLGDPAMADKFFTPLNTALAGLTTPDMFGSVIHANILAMILNQDYIDELSPFGEFLFAFTACFLHVFLLLVIAEKYPSWFDIISIFLIIIQLVGYSYLRLFSFQFFNFKLNLIITLGSLTIASVAISIFNGLFEKYMASQFHTARTPESNHELHPALDKERTYSGEDPESHY